VASLLGLFVRRVLAARTAEFLGFHAFRMLLLVFRGGVIPVLTLTALQCNDFAHFLIPFAECEPRVAAARPWKIT
jgi:hypothetical protein